MTTEEIILEAASTVFTKKGYAAARMDEIANEAGINRALLHYYFRSKEKMFEIVFEKKFLSFFGGVVSTFLSDKPIFEKIEILVEHELNMLVKYPDIPLFLMNELGRNPHRIIKTIQDANSPVKLILPTLETQLKKEAELGIIKPMTAPSFVLVLMGLCIYPFIAKNMILFFMDAKQEDFLKMAASRKQEIIDFMIAGMKP